MINTNYNNERNAVSLVSDQSDIETKNEISIIVITIKILIKIIQAMMMIQVILVGGVTQILLKLEIDDLKSVSAPTTMTSDLCDFLVGMKDSLLR